MLTCFIRKTILVFTFLLIALLPASSQTSGVLQAISLKDGTILKGRVVEVRNGFYRIQTNLTNPVEVYEEDIVSINNIQEPPAQNPSVPLQIPTTAANPSLPGAGQDLKGQINSLSQTLLSDPEMQAAIQELTEDPQIKELLGKQDLLNAILSMNPTTMQDNANVQQLINHPKVQRLMEMISQKFLPRQGSNPLPAK